MSSLFKNLRVHQVFGANTDVGKTIITSALVRASTSRRHNVFYLKPVSTGPMTDADDEHVMRFAGPHKDLLRTDCLFRFQEPVSPHLAAKLASEASKREVVIPSDETFVNSVASHIRRCASLDTGYAHMYVETAGGVHSPTLSGTTQVDGYRPLFLPTILIGDAKLGGISSTISSYESLLLRGYIVDSILLFRDEYYRNWEYLKPYFTERGVHVASFDPPPPLNSNTEENVRLTEDYYQKIVPPESVGEIYETLDHLDTRHRCRLEELDSLPRRTLDTIWWPFVQHSLVKEAKDVNVIDSAWSDFFSVYSPSASCSVTPARDRSLLEPQFDGSASWWTQTVGHAHIPLTMAAARSAGRYGHVMFPQAIHLPALKLAERLVRDGPGKGWAARAFFSDDGSTAMEVALKMALRAYTTQHGKDLDTSEKKSIGILGLKGSYHGDTIGAMDASEEGIYTCEWHNAKGYWLQPPTVSIRQGTVVVTLPPSIAGSGSDTLELGGLGSLSSAYNVSERLTSPLAEHYRHFIERTLRTLRADGKKLGALVLEPLVMGAGGMIFVDPLFQRIMIDVVRASPEPLPVIFDEVFVGLYRLGMESTAPLLGVNPDISVNAKILTGGLLPLSVTLTSDSIFQAFWGDKKAEALLHGHSYTAHPMGCEVANETLSILDKLIDSDLWKDAKSRWDQLEPAGGPSTVWSFWDPSFAANISSMDVVNEVVTLGTVLAIKLKDDQAGYGSHAAQEMLQSIRSSIQDENVLSSAPGGAPYGINFRTLGDIAYFMTSLNTPSATIRAVENRIWNTLQQQTKARSSSF